MKTYKCVLRTTRWGGEDFSYDVAATDFIGALKKVRVLMRKIQKGRRYYIKSLTETSTLDA